MRLRKRGLALLAIVIILFTMFFPVFYIAIESHHHCTGENCPICHEIQLCIQTLNTVGTEPVPVTTVLVGLCLAVACIEATASRCCSRTLVSLKVKLSD